MTAREIKHFSQTGTEHIETALAAIADVRIEDFQDLLAKLDTIEAGGALALEAHEVYLLRALARAATTILCSAVLQYAKVTTPHGD
jgi:hypothetical protein